VCVLSVTRYRVHSADWSKIIPPKGWTTDKKELRYDYWWGKENSDGQRMAKTYGLKPPQPIMRTTRQSGASCYMFQSGSKYYLWNLIVDDVWEIVTSMRLVDIVTEIGKPRYGSLKITKVPEV
jgi:hypothetical protein